MQKPGNYRVSGNDYYAFIRSDYIVYTITETGTADVYLAVEDDQSPITITAKNGNGSETVKGFMRVAITTQEVAADGKTPVGEETLRVVYAKDDETGKGNDSTAKDGWTSIQNVNGKPKLDTVTYPYVYTGNYTDQRISGAKNWAATKDGENFTISTNSEAIATNVGYDGICRSCVYLDGRNRY